MVFLYDIIEMLNRDNADYNIKRVLEVEIENKIKNEPIIDCEENGEYIFIKSKHYIIQIKIQK